MACAPTLADPRVRGAAAATPFESDAELRGELDFIRSTSPTPPDRPGRPPLYDDGSRPCARQSLRGRSCSSPRRVIDPLPSRGSCEMLHRSRSVSIIRSAFGEGTRPHPGPRSGRFCPRRRRLAATRVSPATTEVERASYDSTRTSVSFPEPVLDNRLLGVCQRVYDAGGVLPRRIPSARRCSLNSLGHGNCRPPGHDELCACIARIRQRLRVGLRSRDPEMTSVGRDPPGSST